MKVDDQGSAHVIVIIIILLALICGLVVYRLHNTPQPPQKTHEDSVAQTTEPPCGNAASTIELGAATPDTPNPPMFQTDGNDVYIKATRFSHGGIFDMPAGQGKTRASIGSADTLPAYNQQTREISNVLKEAVLREEAFSKVSLPAQSYWLVNSNGVWIILASCGQLTKL